MFTGINLDESIEPELSDIFWVKLVAKNVVPESLGPIL